ncbi:D-alanyl-D-alanine carboxypeptidase family protein [Paenibacillus crassostreae]|uniref:serine-type D-Ala-D-Ala carboxypeptidase n=1 Tax=Paenibacillus crassostreae TaxID=1763538 RepID=A0A167D411_9BACL|nr:D-alanyl-D-alanine carboxypeptidase family protein [Paenibacillus crassostreae]AOZ92781.1 D-alanyl-D-alanine carboxypeptidase [Paenibacillus crassostreae]OAB73906.1 peptidase M15 [Paenibacillus crassostreae]
MKHKTVKSSKRQLVKKSIASVILLNMLITSSLPLVVLAEAEISTTEATTTNSNSATTEVATTGIKIPDAASLGLQVKSAVLIEPTTGEVLLSINSDVALPPASMTKMMTEYIVAEQVKQGKLSWDQVITVGENAAATIGSRIFLAEGDQHTVEELYIAMAVGSANDATVALAEQVAGSEAAFVDMMNETAERMGMTTAFFINSTGLSRADMPEKFRPSEDRETVMSAMDTAILAKFIVQDHPDFSRFTAIQSHQFRERDTNPIINYNWMLEANKDITNFKAYAYEGLDGLKTGHTEAAGNCFAGTAERDGMRLISVVMGAETNAARFVETKKVLDYGFNNFEIQQVIAPKTTVEGTETVPVKKGVETSVAVVTDLDVQFMVPKGTQNPTITSEVTLMDAEELVAPLAKGTKVGTITYTYKIEGMSEAQEKTVNLVTAEEVEKGGWFRLLFRGIKQLFVDLFDGIMNLF